ncbi:MAG TPA: UvrB/UvrC motif-containing protein [Tepidisphaeraceae bacterium]|nr:UvrB/UvrC motif-containing protein [Tepidisphaeraceae bacterium]
MSEQQHSSSSKKHDPNWPNKDIGSVLKGWDYEPGTINVRKISGADGNAKLQMRLDLGLLQMEMDGRPDGQRPHGFESLLEYFESQLGEHKAKHDGNELGFQLNGSQCASLREEAVMYYHRYLSLFVLEEFPGVVRDTDRNIRVLDLCRKFAQSQQDRLVLEQYRPYITMMNARAKASILFKDKHYAEALDAVKLGMRQIKRFFKRFGQLEAYPHSNEVRVLKRFAREITKKLPIDPVKKLERQLEKAVETERYEEAAKLRDEIEHLKAHPFKLGGNEGQKTPMA